MLVPTAPGISWSPAPAGEVHPLLAGVLDRESLPNREPLPRLPAGTSTLTFHLDGFIWCPGRGDDQNGWRGVGLPNQVPIDPEQEYALNIGSYSAFHTIQTVRDADIPPPDPAAQAACARITRLEPFLYHTEEFTPEGFARLLAWFPQARELWLPGDAPLEFVNLVPEYLPALESVTFGWGNDRPGVDVSFLRRLPNLREVVWQVSEVHPQAMEVVADLPVREVRLDRVTPLSDEELQALARSETIESLTLSYSMRAQMNLSVSAFVYPTNRTGDIGDLAGSGVRRLEIDLPDFPQPRFDYGKLVQLPRLETLELNGYVSPFIPIDLSPLHAHPTLREVILNHASSTVDLLLGISGHPRLELRREVIVNHASSTDDPLMGLSGHPRLERLTVERWTCPPTVLARAVASLPALRVVEFGEYFPAAALLRQLRPDLEIVMPDDD